LAGFFVKSSEVLSDGFFEDERLPDFRVFQGQAGYGLKQKIQTNTIDQSLGILSAHMEQGCAFSRIWILPVF